MVVVASAQAFRPTYLPAGVAELDAALADVDGDNFTRPARVAFVARSFFCSIKRNGSHADPIRTFMNGCMNECENERMNARTNGSMYK